VSSPFQRFETPDLENRKKCPDWLKEIYDTCPPMWGPHPTPGALSLLPIYEDTAILYGRPLRRWQKLAALVGTELMPDGRPRWRHFFVTLPRQGGKSWLEFVGITVDMVMLRAATHGMFVGQSGSAGVQAIFQKWVPKVKHTALWEMLQFRDSKDKANPWLKSELTGVTMDLHTGSEKSGHGHTLYRVHADEVWSYPPLVFEDSIRQAIRAVLMAQIMYYSTVGKPDQPSDLLDGMILANRVAAATRWEGMRRAGLEWSGPKELDPGDEEGWIAATPFLDEISDEGEGVTLESLREDYDSDQTEDKIVWRRAGLNQIGEGTVLLAISLHAYDALVAKPAEAPRPVKPVVLGIDSPPEGGFTTMTACDGAGWLTVVAHERGNHWVVDRLKEDWDSDAGLKPRLLVLKGTGSLTTVAGDLEAAGFTVRRLSSAEESAACIALRDSVHGDDTEDGELPPPVRFVENEAMRMAVRSAKGPTPGQPWKFVRTAPDQNVSPLYSGAFALAGLQELAARPGREAVLYRGGRRVA